MSRPIFNRVTETPPFPDVAWLVSATWRGGHDKRMFLLENVYRSEAEARSELARIERNEHGYPAHSDFRYLSASIHKLVKEHGTGTPD